MASVKSVSIYSDVPWAGGFRKRRYSVILTDNNLVDHTVITNAVKVLESDDGTESALRELNNKKIRELVEGEKISEWQDTQADYDRRALGIAMTLSDVHEFYSYLPLFKAMELRGGANAAQRASYLGVSSVNYNLMANRFGDVEGISFFLDNAKGQIWSDERDFT